MHVCMDVLGAKQLSPGDIMGVTDPEHKELEINQSSRMIQMMSPEFQEFVGIS